MSPPAISQKLATFITTAERTSNPTLRHKFVTADLFDAAGMWEQPRLNVKYFNINLLLNSSRFPVNPRLHNGAFVCIGWLAYRTDSSAHLIAHLGEWGQCFGNHPTLPELHYIHPLSVGLFLTWTTFLGCIGHSWGFGSSWSWAAVFCRWPNCYPSVHTLFQLVLESISIHLTF
jgi:hypothetical protein